MIEGPFYLSACFTTMKVKEKEINHASIPLCHSLNPLPYTYHLIYMCDNLRLKNNYVNFLLLSKKVFT